MSRKDSPSYALNNVPPDVFRRFQERAKANGWPPKGVIIELMRDYADGKIVPSAPRPPLQPLPPLPKRPRIDEDRDVFVKHLDAGKPTERWRVFIGAGQVDPQPFYTLSEALDRARGTANEIDRPAWRQIDDGHYDLISYAPSAVTRAQDR